MTTLLNDPEWARWNNSEIARKCGVVEGLVRKLRASPSASSYDARIEEQPRTVTRNGTTYEMNTANIGGRKDGGASSEVVFDNTECASRDEPPAVVEVPKQPTDLGEKHLWHALREAATPNP